MDNSAVMKRMLETTMKAHPESFANFDTTKNVQDQLQEMLSPRGTCIPLINAFHGWLNEEGKDWTQYFNDGVRDVTSCLFSSMEQLWLAFVMSERFGKVWSGTEWVKKDGRFL